MTTMHFYVCVPPLPTPTPLLTPPHCLPQTPISPHLYPLPPIAAPPVDPKAPKPEGSIITPTAGDQLNVCSTTSTPACITSVMYPCNTGTLRYASHSRRCHQAVWFE